MTNIDDIMHPGYAADQKLAQMDAQIAVIDRMLSVIKERSQGGDLSLGQAVATTDTGTLEQMLLDLQKRRSELLAKACYLAAHDCREQIYAINAELSRRMENSNA